MYIRFGDIPDGEKSKIWRDEHCVGEEIGVSVYDVKIGERGEVNICLPLPLSRDALDTFRALVEYQNRPCYLVDGEYLGVGNDGEPIIRNVRIIEEIQYRK